MADSPLVPFDAGKPNVARLHDYALGGKDNYAVDREVAAELEEVFPLAPVLARESREFVARAVAYVAAHGVTQFIDVGSGMPASPATHEVAGAGRPGARVAYVDNDPMVISHTAALVARPGEIAAVPGDVRSPRDILARPELAALIDTSAPFCVILAMILNFVAPAQARRIVAELREAMPAGSYLVMSVGVNQDTPDVARDVHKVYQPAAEVHTHRREEVEGYFEGMEMVAPGLTQARRWRPGRPPPGPEARPADALAGVGRQAPRG